MQAFADTRLRPRALETDRDGVSPDVVSALGEIGALNHLAPESYGGAGLDVHGDRHLHEIIAGACLNTWLVWAQHAPIAGRIGEPRSELASLIVRGQELVGAAVSDVRRYPERFIKAARTPDGWIFDGQVSWVSGWGLNRSLAVAAVDPAQDSVITALVPVTPRMVASPLRLSAVTGSHTWRVLLDGVVVPEEHVLSVQDLASWRAADLAHSSDAKPHHFGLAAAVLRELDASADPLARDVAAAWRPRIERLRADAYRLTDSGGALDLRLRIKIDIGEALGTVTRALVAARSGRGLADDDVAQLHARSALFLLVQGQSAVVREAQLKHFSDILRFSAI
ncbi:acyl-CoA dehydrogenase family protein [Actinoplanes couchii]|uniref:acyl-CoA dehydrogenase family protein n=1 Tax=Actinoplanes couchii TaxID=403638 RepID=UPI001942F871|nr:acyl-CoA dehydrogenase family protein [Actinoplanes couchii]MDR6317592.1 hypothetical protein [Actinoplanes couchii]